MRLNEFIVKIGQYFRAVQDRKQEVLIIAAMDVLADMGDRIHVQGLDASMTVIGSYSTKPFYFNSKKFGERVGSQVSKRKIKRLKPVGKTGRTVFKSTGKAHLTTYIKGGYKELRGLVGRQNEHVDFNFTASMYRSLSAGGYKGGSAIGFSGLEFYQRAEKLERKYKRKIWKLTDAEKQVFYRSVAKQILKIRREYLGE